MKKYVMLCFCYAVTLFCLTSDLLCSSFAPIPQRTRTYLSIPDFYQKSLFERLQLDPNAPLLPSDLKEENTDPIREHEESLGIYREYRENKIN